MQWLCLQLHCGIHIQASESLLPTGEGLRATALIWGTLSTGSLGSPRDEEKEKLRILNSSLTCLYSSCHSYHWNKCHYSPPAMGLGTESQTNPSHSALLMHPRPSRKGLWEEHPDCRCPPPHYPLSGNIAHWLRAGSVLTLSISQNSVCMFLTAPATLDIFSHSHG